MSIFTDYSKKVKYDYIFKANINIDNQFNDNEAIENLLSDEDLLKIYFPQVGLGNVYSDSVIRNNSIIMRFGITETDKETDFNSSNIKNDITDFILSFNKNIEYFKNNNIKGSDIKVSLLKANESYDKKLVSESSLIFKNDNINELKLTDEGKVEYYIDNILKESFDFSKQKVNTLCEDLVKDGAELQDKIDLDQTEKDLRDSIDKVDQLQDLKDQLTDKVNTLMESSFPSSELTKKRLCLDDIKEDQLLDEILSEEQLKWIETNISNRHHFSEGLKDLWNLITVDPKEPVISIDEYINELLKGDNEND